MKRPPRKATKSFDAEGEVPADVPSSPPPADDGYKVGPGRPPREYQFKPGQSGNPKGAKRKSQSIARDLKAILDRELNAKVPVKQGDKLLTMTMAEAGIKQLIAQYAKGDRHARSDLIALADKLGVVLTSGHDHFGEALTQDHQAILDAYFERRSQASVGCGSTPVLAPPELLDDDIGDGDDK